LRRTLTDALTSLTTQFAKVHNLVHQYANDEDLQQYHGIYDISLTEYLSAVNATPLEYRGTLRDLRFSFKTLSLARKVLLCDLLALPSQSFWQNTQHLACVSSRIQNLVSRTVSAIEVVNNVLAEEGSRTWSEGRDLDQRTKSQLRGEPSSATPGSEQIKAQKRRLDALATGIRSMNARLHLFQQEADAISDTADEGSQLSSTLSKQYDSIGAELKGLVAEWEQGKKTMLLSVNTLNRCSQSSSGLQTPISRSSSLGGLTMVDDGPADALRALNGDDAPQKLSDFAITDEEVFEAVALPRKRMSVLLSREERMAKIQEDRKKRATLQEHADRTTNMLRELEMVIKHRPRGRTTSQITTL
jgi:Mysoin-binding motif of peroxisomes